jgi:hypothetical protein
MILLFSASSFNYVLWLFQHYFILLQTIFLIVNLSA